MSKETFDYDNLVSSKFPIVTDRQTLAEGENLIRGTVLGKRTSGGALAIVDSNSSDGTENPYAVLAEDVDASLAENLSALIYLSGQFNEDKLVFSTGDTIADFKDAMRDKSLFVSGSLQS